MSKPNTFEQHHRELLEKAEAAALKALQQITKGETVAPTTDAVRIDAAKAILAIRSEDG